MRTLLAALTCLLFLPAGAGAQDIMDTLGAAAAYQLAQQHLDVPQAAVDRFNPDAFDSRSTGFRKVEASYVTARATDCRLAAALWLMAIASTVGETGSYGEWTGSVKCSQHSVDLRMRIDPGQTRWWLSQYDLDGNRIYRASNP